MAVGVPIPPRRQRQTTSAPAGRYRRAAGEERPPPGLAELTPSSYVIGLGAVTRPPARSAAIASLAEHAQLSDYIVELVGLGHERKTMQATFGRDVAFHAGKT